MRKRELKRQCRVWEKIHADQVVEIRLLKERVETLEARDDRPIHPHMLELQVRDLCSEMNRGEDREEVAREWIPLLRRLAGMIAGSHKRAVQRASDQDKLKQILKGGHSRCKTS